MKRRQFIILTGIGATGAGVMSACGHPENRLIPALIPDEEYVPGIDYWKATSCAMCAAGCGIIVRTREHKANKIEGNPLHPVNRGALCARGQAGLQVLYNPDRVRAPLRRAGERGSGRFEEITWDEAIKALADKLREVRAQTPPESGIDPVAFMSADPLNISRLMAEHFMSAYGSKSLVSAHHFPEQVALLSYEGSYGRSETPLFDIANATYLLSFGARFLETWHSPVMYSLAYGEFRRTTGRARGKFVQVEPRMSLTAANADEWLPAAPGTEGLAALAIAQVIVREGLIKDAPALKLEVPLDEYAPEKTAGRIDIPAEKLIRIAREFAASERPLAIGGGAASTAAGGVDSLGHINSLNTLAGNVGKPGGVLFPSAATTGPFEKLRPKKSVWWSLITGASVEWNDVKCLMVHSANPLYSMPELAEKIKRVGFIASFSSFMDETTELADLILPDHTYLESWDISTTPAGGDQTAFTLTRPAVKPEFNTRQTADVLIALSRELGEGTAQPIPFESSEAVVKQAAGLLQKAGGSITAESEDDFWKTFTERGVWIGKAESAAGPERRFSRLSPVYPAEVPAENSEEYPFVLMAYEHAALGFGAQANLPWLQELPDPMTSVMWGSWVEINPKTAAALGVMDGDLVEVTTTLGAVRAPAVIYPAIRPDVIAIPYGQGHTSYGRYARGRGASAAALEPFVVRQGVVPMTFRAKVAKVEGRARLVRFGTSLPEHIEGER